MSDWVVDASVIVKWIFPQRPKEADGERALALLEAIRRGEVAIVQPPHWLAEAAAVATRLDAGVAVDAVPLLYALEFPIADGLEIYRRAIELSAELNQHLFDTLYHAVALLHPDTLLVTADDSYYRKAAKLGAMIRLTDLSLG